MSTIALNALSFLVGLLPWRAAQRLGAALGLIWFHALRIRRRTVLENLARAFPDLPAVERLARARAAYRHFGISALELLRLAEMSPGEVTARVHASGMERFRAAAERGRGVVIATAHFGNFDLLACSQALAGVPLAIVSRDLKGRGANAFWMASRRATGLAIFPEDGGALAVARWLRQGKVLGLTIDQRVPAERGGIQAGFFGWPVWTTTAPALLAARLGAALLPVRLERRDDGDHDLVVEPEIAVARPADPAEIERVTAELNRVLEGWIRRRPEQWMWLHRRFRSSKIQNRA